MSERPIVAVIGAGFSGVLTALRLLQADDGPAVLLIERGPRFARGTAYATTSPQHLLNVRAENMSAFPEEPGHFLAWLGEGGVAPGQTFVTRQRYGQYLQWLLRQGSGDRGAVGRLMLENDEVKGLGRDGEGWRIELGLGRRRRADAVVLALGALAPPEPEGLDRNLATSPRYVPDPWSWDPAGVPGDGDVLLLGAGLTAVDMALEIHQRRPGARIHALSRHGFAPQHHASEVREAPVISPSGSPLEVLRAFRAAAEPDWRAAVDGLRPHVQRLWRSWTLQEKRLFLRRLRPWWELGRHRLAPAVWAQLEGLKTQGLFSVAAGRLQRLSLREDGVEATWRRRGNTAIESRDFAVVVNCTGPRTDLLRSGEPLVSALVRDGVIRADACGLGLDVDAWSRPIGADGQAHDTLFAVGPLTRGQYYEITSVPDIRIQAADCAGAILGLLSLKTRPLADAAAHGADRLARELETFFTEAIEAIDVDLGDLRFARRLSHAWELRGRRAAFGELALWLEKWREGNPARRGADNAA